MSFPNQLSLLRILLSPVFLFLFLSENLLYKKISLIVFFIAVFTDWYDGWHARKFGEISKAGIFLDPLADKILTSSAFIGFFILGIMPLWMVILIVIRDIVITVLRSMQEYKGKTMKTSFIAKTKTFIQMTYIFLIVILVSLLSFNISPEFSSLINNFLVSETNYMLMLIVTLITVATGVFYFFEKDKASIKTLS
ncbi:MAG TPA: CDP-diacylglycerol--glycerol-3-phosphate 3-phosphatidyltransferase [Ignavibacteria bacterium]|nr:CDP-diacylglycerol--glycerol-3-phosphate 3-phosphatidyltransferase [Ignavibacteria bacterium]HMR40592.1 CDP-diacylglycerol--glycerol-3-phosphate 3-phosphatidyltransferase [Ignavibacteria bacterium]